MVIKERLRKLADAKEARREKILNEPLFPLLIKTSLPTMVGMMVTLIYNLTDTFCIGFLGNKSMTAAIGIVFSFISFIQALGFWFGYGSGNKMSRLLGAKQEEEARKVAACGVFLAVISSVVIVLLCFAFKGPLIRVLGGNASDSLNHYVDSYLTVMLLAVPFTLYAFTVYNQIRLCGNVKDAMIGILAGMLTNIILDPVFIYGFRMEVAGAGVATLIGHILSTFVLVRLMHMHGNIPAHFSEAKFTKERLYNILVGGAPNFSRQSITSIASIILNSIASGYGEVLVAAFTVATRIISLGNMLMIGFGQGFQPICAMNYGAGQFDRVKKALSITVIIGSVFLLISTILIAVYAVPLSALLSSNEDVIMLSAKIVRFQCLSLPVMAVFALSSMFLQNVGRYFPALFISVSRQGFVFLPLLFILNAAYGELGLYILQPVADIISTAFSVVLVYVFWNKIFPNEKKRNPEAITKSYGKR